MRPGVRGFAIGAGTVLCVYLMGLVAFAPAALLDVVVRNASHGKARLAVAQGTLWSGAARAEISASGGVPILGRDFAWRFEPRSLMQGRLGFEVDLAGATKRFPLALSPYGIEISDADFELPAAVLVAAAPSLVAISPTGNLRVRITALSAARGEVTGNAVIEWRSAGSSLTRVFPLGDYELRLEGRAGRWTAALRTLNGPLYLEGASSGPASGPPTLLATARVDPRVRPQLAPFLRLIAVERRDGTFALQIGQEMGRVAPSGAAPG